MGIVATLMQATEKYFPLLYRPANNILLPYYHLIDSVEPTHTKHLYAIPTVEKFEKDVEFLCANYKPITIDDIVYALKSGDYPSEPSFHITFDDGFRQVYDFAAPILKDNAAAASVYLNTATIDNKLLLGPNKASLIIEASIEQGIPKAWQKYSLEEFKLQVKRISINTPHLLDEVLDALNINIDDFLHNYKPHLTREQIIEMAKQGFTFGAHTHEHKFLQELPLEQQKWQISESVRLIRDNLGLPCQCFAFPFLDMGVALDTYEHLKAENIGVSFGTNSPRSDPVDFSLQRMSFGAKFSTWHPTRVLRAQAARSIAYKIFKKNIITRAPHSKA
jgi:peptidoglycan/xylan/chitin deacetylase (PgdA/CDA1 family)